MKLSGDMKLLAGAAVLGVLALWYVKSNAPKIAQDVATGAVKVVGGVVQGTALGLGDLVGVPRTNETECQKALREGRTWDASFACSAGDFIRGLF